MEANRSVKKKRWLLLLLVAMMVTTVVAGCSGNESAGSNSKSEGSSNTGEEKSESPLDLTSCCRYSKQIIRRMAVRLLLNLRSRPIQKSTLSGSRMHLMQINLILR